MKILILASNPRKDLNLDREIRDLKGVIEKSRNRAQFEVVIELAVQVKDLQQHMLNHEPQIVHFCGHGGGEEGLVFEGNDGGEQWVRAEALSDLFRVVSISTNVCCVLLNACYSEEQANAIVNHIDYVIGMNQEIRDDAAIAFSKGFYQALGYERSIEEAYEFGKNAIWLEISGSSKMRSVATEETRKAEVVGAIGQTTIPEHLKPILKTKPTLTTSSKTTITAHNQPISQETRTAIQLDIDKSLEKKINTQLPGQHFKFNDFYRIISKTTGKVLAISNRSTKQGADLIQWKWLGGEEQKFQIFRSEGEGEYSLRANHSRQCVAVTDGSRDAGASLIQWECNGGYDEQQFSLIPLDGYYAIKAKHSGMVITVNRNEEKIRQYPQSSGQFSDDQLFRIEEV